jgi:hypothetical protein
MASEVVKTSEFHSLLFSLHCRLGEGKFVKSRRCPQAAAYNPNHGQGHWGL